MIHVGNTTPTIIGDNCSITHHCTIHGADVGDNCLIGINSTLMDGAKIGANSIVAGHSIVTEGTIIPPNSIVAGAPAKVIRTRDNRVANAMNAAFYYENAKAYAVGDHRVTERDAFARAMEAELRAMTS
jgi:carbonic anhydrase/acetyltransferase-like protein (isoleucine patch superfamily)